MAWLRNRETRETLLLPGRALVGRSARCELRLEAPEVSGEHACIAWRGGRWAIKDLGSRNGTFLNEERVASGAWVPLVDGNSVRFGGVEAPGWSLADAAPPRPIARLVDGDEVVLDQHGLLTLPPNGEPHWVVFARGNHWAAERVDGETREVGDGATLVCREAAYVLRLPDPQEATREARGPSIGEIDLRFRVSRDEEHVAIQVVHAGGEIEIEPREHGYVLLTLARARLEDETMAQAEQGWRDRDLLLRMLAMDTNHLNVAIFRARRQFAEAGIAEAARLVETRRHQRRLGVDRVDVC